MGSNPERPGKNLSKTAAARSDGNDMHQEQAAQARASRGMRSSKTKMCAFRAHIWQCDTARSNDTLGSAQPVPEINCFCYSLLRAKRRLGAHARQFGGPAKYNPGPHAYIKNGGTTRGSFGSPESRQPHFAFDSALCFLVDGKCPRQMTPMGWSLFGKVSSLQMFARIPCKC